MKRLLKLREIAAQFFLTIKRYFEHFSNNSSVTYCLSFFLHLSSGLFVKENIPPISLQKSLLLTISRALKNCVCRFCSQFPICFGTKQNVIYFQNKIFDINAGTFIFRMFLIFLIISYCYLNNLVISIIFK